MFRAYFTNRWVIGGFCFLIVFAIACYFWSQHELAPYKQQAAENAEMLRQHQETERATTAQKQKQVSATNQTLSDWNEQGDAPIPLGNATETSKAENAKAEKRPAAATDSDSVLPIISHTLFDDPVLTAAENNETIAHRAAAGAIRRLDRLQRLLGDLGLAYAISQAKSDDLLLRYEETSRATMTAIQRAKTAVREYNQAYNTYSEAWDKHFEIFTHSGGASGHGEKRVREPWQIDDSLPGTIRNMLRKKQ